MYQTEKPIGSMQKLGGNYRLITGEKPNKNSGGTFKIEGATQFFTS